MRTSLTEIERIENWLLKRGDVEDRLVTEARVLSGVEWKDKVRWQSTAYDLIQLYGHKKLREEVKSVEHQLFQTSKYRPFQNRIRAIFKR
ncbi:MAG: hypothetical protein AAF519_02955 [Bacteroidota bacterium]